MSSNTANDPVASHNDISEEEPSRTMAVLAEISQTMISLNNAFALLNGCTDLIGLPSQSERTQQETESLSQKIEEHDRWRRNALEDVKVRLKDDIQREVAAAVSRHGAESTDLIRDEVGRQAKEQVDEQIKEHLPESLEHQAAETKQQLKDVMISLQNSEARIANSFIHTNNLLDLLAPILTRKGERSPFWPSNAHALFSYDLESAKELNKDYELAETENLQMNFKQFLEHIGTGIDIVVHEAET